MKKFGILFLAGLLLITVASCISLRARQGLSVIGYRNNKVYIKRNLLYSVGRLPEGWRRFNVYAKAVAFHNGGLSSTISTDASCGAAFEDLPLNVLTGHMFAGIKKHSIINEGEIILDSVPALRTRSRGFYNDRDMFFDSVVVKKNGCTIDFVLVAPPDNYDSGVADFEAFYKGFAF